MTVWETLWSLDLTEAFLVFVPPLLSALAAGLVLCLATSIYRAIHGRKIAGQVILKARPTNVKRVFYSLLGVLFVLAFGYMVFAGCAMFYLFFIKQCPFIGAGDLRTSGFPPPPELFGRMGRLLLPMMVCYVVGGLFACLCGIEYIYSAFRRFTIRSSGIQAYTNPFTPFFSWNRIRRVVYYKPNALRIELDIGCRKFSVHPMHIEQVAEAFGRFVEVVDHETYLASEKGEYPRPRRRFQFRLCTLMLVTLLLAVFSGHLGARLREAMRIQQIYRELRQSGADVYGLMGLTSDISWLEEESPPTDDDLAILEELDCVTWISVFGPQITDEGLRHFSSLETLQVLKLNETNVKGKGLKHLASLKRLDWLALNKSAVTNDALAILSGLMHLKCLELDNTKISDTGLGHLANIQTLKSLSLENTPITDAGLQQIGKLKNLGELNLSGTQVTDAGLVHLAGLTCLRDLNLDGTTISDKGLMHLASLKKLKALSLQGTKVTDKGLVHLKHLPELMDVDLNGTAVTKAAAEKIIPEVFTVEVSEQNDLSDSELKDDESDDPDSPF